MYEIFRYKIIIYFNIFSLIRILFYQKQKTIENNPIVFAFYS